MGELIRATVLLAALHSGPPQPPAQAFMTWVPAAPDPVVAPADAWLGGDKFQHFGMSYATTAFAFAALSAAGLDTDGALAVAVPVGAAAGIGKELFDRRRGDLFSVKDLVADALGVAAAYFFLREVQ